MLRSGSGGIGKFHGGCGVIREYVFRSPLTLSVLSERRALQPFGMEGKLPFCLINNFMIWYTFKGVYPEQED